MQLRPGERSFFKYATADTVLAILRSGVVRYSSPLTFNDPFDVQSGLHFDFDLSTLHGRLLDRLEQLATQAPEPKVDASDPWGKLVLLIRGHFAVSGFPRRRWQEQ